MAEEKEAAPEAKKEGGNKKLIIIIAAAVLVLVAVGGAAWFFLAKGDGKDAAQDGDATKTVKKAKVDENGNPLPPIGPIIEVNEFVINIMDKGETRFLKAAMSLELDSPKVAEELKQRLPQVRDTILLHMGSKTFDELSDLQGKLQLRAELIAKLNAFLEQGKIMNIYFTSFVIQ